MREILFRGKRVDNGEWIFGDIMQIPSYNIVRIFEQSNLTRCETVKYNTVGQYTGLTDKNGKRIFENDICRLYNDEPNEAERYTNYVIQWDIVNCRFVVVTADNCEDVLDRFFSEKSEVITNLHDNPELLEGRQ